MKTEHRTKPRISTEFKLQDGSTATRSKMEDFETLSGRIYTRLVELLGKNECTLLLLPGVKAYNVTKYELALAYFVEAIKHHHEIAEELRPHIRICNRVIASVLTPKDVNYSDMFEMWKKLPRLIKYFRRTPVFKIRCKYCGHFTRYISPEEGFAYLDSNNCELCGRGYPVPEFAWDGVDGLAYIYYRHSVIEPEFYKEFEQEYNVNPDHTFFLPKNKN